MSQPEITIYTTRWCPFCVRAKSLLNRKTLSYTEIGVDGDPETRRAMAARAGRTSVPQIWIGDRHIGGCDELHALESRGQLDALTRGDG
ncbi:glutaredoxin 3 [Luminiphilus sp.]|nr:glutaredoxin 3 [Luminiphilus sp.]